LMPDAIDGPKMREWVSARQRHRARLTILPGREDDGFEDHEGIQTPADELYRERAAELQTKKARRRIHSPNARRFSRNIPNITALIC